MTCQLDVLSFSPELKKRLVKLDHEFSFTGLVFIFKFFLYKLKSQETSLKKMVGEIRLTGFPRESIPGTSVDPVLNVLLY